MSKTVKKGLSGALALGIAGLAFSGGAAAMEKGDWLVRGGLTMVAPNDDSGEVTGIADSGVAVDSAVNLGVSAAYFLNGNVAVEILGALPFTHTVEGEGSIGNLGDIADVTHLPPTVSLQYYFDTASALRPYVGVGLNYTVFFDEEVTSDALKANYDEIELDDSVGLALQVGADYRLQNDWFVNADLRYIDIGTEAELSGSAGKATVDVDIDPTVFTLAVGKQF